MNKKKGVSPVVATVLLITIAIIVIIIIFIWARGAIGEERLKREEPVKNLCGEISLDVSISGNLVDIVNTGLNSRPVMEYKRIVLKDRLNAIPPLGESWVKMKRRIGSFFISLRNKPYKEVLIVSHEDPLKAALSILKKMPNEKAYKIKIPTAKIIKVLI